MTALKRIMWTFKRISRLSLLILATSTALSTVAAPSLVHAQTDAPAAPLATSETASDSSSGANWFFYLSTGLGRPSYDGSIQSRIDEQKRRGGGSEYAGSFDLPGVYRRIGSGWAAGAVLNMMFENVARAWGDRDSFQVQILNPSASAMYFPGGTIGLGWFARADLGLSRILQIRQSLTPAETFARANDTGVIVQGAGGYGWPAGSAGQVLAHVNGFYSSAGPRHATGLNFHVGFLF